MVNLTTIAIFFLATFLLGIGTYLACLGIYMYVMDFQDNASSSMLERITMFLFCLAVIGMGIVSFLVGVIFLLHIL